MMKEAKPFVMDPKVMSMHKELSVKSRVRGDFHARFCERVRVKLPRSTRPDDSRPLCMTNEIFPDICSYGWGSVGTKADDCPSKRERVIVGSFRHYLHQYPCTYFV